MYSQPSLTRQTCLSPCQSPGWFSCHIFYLTKSPSSPLVLAMACMRLTLCKLTSILATSGTVGQLSECSCYLVIIPDGQHKCHGAAAASLLQLVVLHPHPLHNGIQQHLTIDSTCLPNGQTHHQISLTHCILTRDGLSHQAVIRSCVNGRTV